MTGEAPFATMHSVRPSVGKPSGDCCGKWLHVGLWIDSIDADMGLQASIDDGQTRMFRLANYTILGHLMATALICEFILPLAVVPSGFCSVRHVVRARPTSRPHSFTSGREFAGLHLDDCRPEPARRPDVHHAEPDVWREQHLLLGWEVRQMADVRGAVCGRSGWGRKAASDLKHNVCEGSERSARRGRRGEPWKHKLDIPLVETQVRPDILNADATVGKTSEGLKLQFFQWGPKRFTELVDVAGENVHCRLIIIAEAAVGLFVEFGRAGVLTNQLLAALRPW
eukprot:CAMPEP_0179142832 /NCGR_PEP_ID=MMETSP0796-20121207/68636_1 /TAXON_ID=73915 /ORGANISM="Pyrodinium bahamense, Strain pbaha01" /LENGTH=282 /DNA_ID=CAMNT_0020842761 /DNA_START=407 /DNA_END=1255 /DNA_ORIENTATION=-